MRIGNYKCCKVQKTIVVTAGMLLDFGSAELRYCQFLGLVAVVVDDGVVTAVGCKGGVAIVLPSTDRSLSTRNHLEFQPPIYAG